MRRRSPRPGSLLELHGRLRRGDLRGPAHVGRWTVWVRVDGDQVVVTHCAPSGPAEVARHQRSTLGHPMIDGAHYPARPAGPLARRPKPTSTAGAEFLAFGEGVRLWLVEAA